MSRLNFTQMVNKTLLGHQENKFFNTTQIISEDFYEPEKYTAKIKQAQKRLDLDGKINNIVYHVHEQLREQQFSPNKLNVKRNALKKKQEEKCICEKQLQPITKVNENINSRDKIKCKNLSIPRMKVLCSDKQQKRVHKSTVTTSNYISYENHKRMIEALKRQNELENLLKEQNLIKEDHQSIAKDIFAIGHCLDDLQHRVNNSLKHLHSKKTYCECQGIKRANSCKKCLDNIKTCS